MSLFANFNVQQFIHAFSWMLVHSLWQGLLLAVVCGTTLTIWKRSGSAFKYNLTLIHFLLFIAGCAVTYLLEWNARPVEIAVNSNLHNATPLLPAIHIKVVSAFVQSSIRYFSDNAAMILLVWFVVFLFRGVQMMGGLLYVRRAKRRNIYDPPIYWNKKIDQLCKKIQLSKTVKLLESGYVKVPMILGHLKPVILIPAGLLSGLPPEQVEAVLLHELAHIKRNDYLVNLLQIVTETVFFFNPGLFWISALLREERENCCDDIALRQTNNKKDLIHALISFKEHALNSTSYAVAFPGKKNMLFKRVNRIINNNSSGFAPVDKALFLSGTLILLTIVVLLTINRSYLPYNDMVIERRQQPKEQLVVVKKDLLIKNKNTTKAVSPNKRNKIALNIPVQPEPPVPINTEDLVSIPNPEKIQNDQMHMSDADLQIKRGQEQVAKYTTQAKLDREQSARDMEQVKRDMEQSRLDQIQAKKDMEQARLDQIQAAKEVQQAKRDYMEVIKHTNNINN